MNKKISLGTAIAVTIVSIAVTICMTMVVSTNNFSDMVYLLKERANMYDKIDEIDNLVRQHYNGDINEEFLNDSISRGYVSGIEDKHSVYLNPEEYEELSEGYGGKKVGIGVTTTQDSSGYIKIIEVYKDSPAYDMGIEKEDLIVKVGDLDVSKDTYGQAIELLKGDEGTSVEVTVRKDKEDEKIELTRRPVEIPTVNFEMHDKMAYIQISRFNDLTTDQFKEALKNASSQNAKGIIFDVRNNPGGTIESVTEVLDLLLPKGPIVSAVYKDGTEEILGESDSKETNLPMVVLINENTASAGELFAQALKDYDKAELVGVKSYGKGSMQRIYKLSDGSAIDITIAKYNPPKSDNYDGIGIIPDYEVKLSQEEQDNFHNLDETNDPQLIKALEIIGNLVVAGGDVEESEEENEEEERIDTTDDIEEGDNEDTEGTDGEEAEDTEETDGEDAEDTEETDGEDAEDTEGTDGEDAEDTEGTDGEDAEATEGTDGEDVEATEGTDGESAGDTESPANESTDTPVTE